MHQGYEAGRSLLSINRTNEGFEDLFLLTTGLRFNISPKFGIGVNYNCRQDYQYVLGSLIFNLKEIHLLGTKNAKDHRGKYRHYLGLTSGINQSGTVSHGFSYRVDNNVFMGITYEYHFHPKWHLGADLYYNKLARGNKYVDRYLNFPIKIKRQIGNKFYGFGAVGLNTYFKLNSNTETDYGIYRIGAAATGEIGSGYSFPSSFSIYMALSFNQSISPLGPVGTGEPLYSWMPTWPETIDYNSLYYRSLNLSIGIKYGIGKTKK